MTRQPSTPTHAGRQTEALPGTRSSPGATGDGTGRASAPVELAWPAAPAHPQLDGPEAHVWALLLDWPAESRSALESLLSPAEIQRAARFHFTLHRNRFIVGRALLRRVLGEYLRTEPQALQFAYGPQGKPALAGPFANRGWHFNLGHSEDLALLAVTRTGPIGVDVEYLRPLSDADQLVARFFSARECAAYQDLPCSERTAAFFNLWTRKEAWLKATGEGIGHLLNQVEVSFLPGEPAQVLRLPPGTKDESWSLYNLAPARNFAGALALAAPVSRLHCWRWHEPRSRS